MKARLLPLLLLALAGCGDDEGTPAAPDAAVSVDAAVDDDAPAGDACPVTGDTTCGGVLDGAWSFVAHCPESPDDIPCENPFSGTAACEDAGNSVACTLAVTGSLTFTADQVHVVRDLAVDATYVFTDACLAEVRDEPTPAEACAALDGSPALTCTHDAAGCTCTGRSESKPIDESVAYTATGSDLTFADFTATYCVDGDTLTLDFDPHPASWRYWVLTR